MTEWTVVLELVTLLGLISTVAKPVLRLNSTITRLTSRLDSIAEELETLTAKNAQSHDRLWEKSREHDAALAEQARRIASLEANTADTAAPARNTIGRGGRECCSASVNC